MSICYKQDSCGSRNLLHTTKSSLCSQDIFTSSALGGILKCMYTNIDGLNAPKGEELNIAVTHNDPDVLCIVETKLNEQDVVSQYLDCKDYWMFRKDRNHCGGGVLIMVKKELEVAELPKSICPDIEAAACVIRCTGSQVLLCCIYRPPNASKRYNKMVRKVIKKMSNLGHRQIIICGDFNYRQINWAKNIATGHEPKKFLDVCQDVFLYQHVREHTRSRGGDKPSLLDLVLTKNNLDIEAISYSSPIGKSDHCMLGFEMCIDSGEALSTKEADRKLNYHKGRYDQAIEKFKCVKWKEELETKDIESMWNTFLEKYNNIVDECVPMYAANKVKGRKKWMNRHLLRMTKKKDEAWKKHRKHKKSKRLRKAYQKLRNQVTTTIRRAKSDYEHSLAKEVKQNPKVFFAYARSKTTIKEDVMFVNRDDGQQTTSLKETCEIMNREFERVFVRECVAPSPTPSTFQGMKLSALDITVEEVKKLLCDLQVQSAAGPDGVHPRVLKECAEVLAEPLTFIYEHSLNTSSMPYDWKRGNITPIYKKGSKTNPLNYRPISLTSVVCKTLEKIVRHRIMEHLEDNKYLTHHQHGFRSNKSCLTQLLEYLHYVEDVVDDGGCVDAVYLDVAKAFDSVPHKLLLLKLQAVGIDGQVLSWVQDFLTNRQQRVKIKGACSEWRKVWSGVPQGSVLGPTLFLVYVNDLLDDIRSNGKLFADDAKIFRRVKNSDDTKCLQDDLCKLDEWSRKWSLKFNKDKCKVMHFGTKNQGHNYTMGGTTLSTTSSEKDLGIIITSNMKLSTQVAKAASTANSMLGRIKRTFTCLDEETLPALYKALVRPRMEYAIQTWSPYLKKDIKMLEKVQRRATKLVRSISHLTYQDRLKHLKLTTLEKRRQRGDMIQVFKLLKGFDHVNMEGNFLKLDENQRTRGHNLKLCKPRHRTWKRNQFFSSRVVEEWNRLPEKVINSKSINSFKHHYDQYQKNDQEAALTS